MNWTDAFEGIEGMEDMETDRFEDGVPCGPPCEKPIQSLRKRNASYRADYLFIRPKGYRTPSDEVQVHRVPHLVFCLTRR
jgi:hypothetical protein